MNASVTHLGGETGVTGSCHLLRSRGVNILVDCGLTQGRDAMVPPEQWPVPPAEIDFVFLTHAHIDHIGLLPRLIQLGFDGEIICTEPTRRLLLPMLNDAMKFAALPDQEKSRVVRRIDALSWAFEYGRVFDLKNGIVFKLGRAGHILGSCFIRFECPKGGESLLFSGDLGSWDRPLLPDPDTPEPADVVFLESTYGDRLHTDRAERIRRMAGVLDRSLADGGKVYIPAFALGRTQEILFDLDRIFSEPALRAGLDHLRADNRPPVFVDSPLGLEITRIYADLSAFWDEQARDLLRRRDDPLDFAALYSAAQYREHRQLLEWPGAAIIIAGSGMCSGGRIVDHLRVGIENRRNDIVFVGFQAQGTPGRSILEQAAGHGRVTLDDEEKAVHAKVHVLSGYSAHADQAALIRWVGAMGSKPRRIKLVHGEAQARQTLAEKLRQLNFDGIE
jgi:metallo-beta-lactamase family protein